MALADVEYIAGLDSGEMAALSHIRIPFSASTANASVSLASGGTWGVVRGKQDHGTCTDPDRNAAEGSCSLRQMSA